MKTLALFLLFISISAFSQYSIAAPVAQVESLQMPAWIKRNNRLHALRLNMSLQAGDRIVTGKNARVLLSLAEGSHIKLGEKANFQLQKAQAGNVFTGLFRLVSGAFRFTTDALQKNSPRDINIGIGAISIGIRGTDIWGKAQNDKDIIALLEGSIEVSRDGQTPIPMSQAMTHYELSKSESIQQASAIDPQRLGVWAQETELQAQQGIISASGKYRLNLMSLSNADYVQSNIEKFEISGYAIENEVVSIQGQDWTRLYISNIQSLAGATWLKQALELQLGLAELWVK